MNGRTSFINSISKYSVAQPEPKSLSFSAFARKEIERHKAKGQFRIAVKKTYLINKMIESADARKWTSRTLLSHSLKPMNNTGARKGIELIQFSLAARVSEPISGRVMELWTTDIGVQFYSGNFLAGSGKGKGGRPYDFRSAFCMETQHFPDTPNKKHFPQAVLRPGEIYKKKTMYRFLVMK